MYAHKCAFVVFLHAACSQNGRGTPSASAVPEQPGFNEVFILLDIDLKSPGSPSIGICTRVGSLSNLCTAGTGSCAMRVSGAATGRVRRPCPVCQRACTSGMPLMQKLHLCSLAGWRDKELSEFNTGESPIIATACTNARTGWHRSCASYP